jgi:hypothetical protein
VGVDNEEKNIQNKTGFNPWLTIFYRPRVTCRWLLANESVASANSLWLSFTAFMVVSLFLQVWLTSAVGEQVTDKMSLVIATPFIFVISYLYYRGESFMLSWASGKVGGIATLAQMRIINSYATVIPGVILGIADLLLEYCLGKDAIAYLAAEVIIMVWTQFITVICISETAGVKPMKGLLIYLISLVPWIVIAVTLFQLPGG